MDALPPAEARRRRRRRLAVGAVALALAGGLLAPYGDGGLPPPGGHSSAYAAFADRAAMPTPAVDAGTAVAAALTLSPKGMRGFPRAAIDYTPTADAGVVELGRTMPLVAIAGSEASLAIAGGPVSTAPKIPSIASAGRPEAGGSGVGSRGFAAPAPGGGGFTEPGDGSTAAPAPGGGVPTLPVEAPAIELPSPTTTPPTLPAPSGGPAGTPLPPAVTATPPDDRLLPFPIVTPAGPTAEAPLSPVPAAGAGAVPEPASWALLTIGFGAAGAMLRRRRRPVLA